MATEFEMPAITFAGSKKVQQVAQRAFEVMRARGMFMSDIAPIRVRKDDLAAFLTETAGASAGDVVKAISENPEVFAIETDAEGAEVVVTTRKGSAPILFGEDTMHTFPNRMMTPEPKPAKPAMPPRERVRVDPSWATFELPEFDAEDELAYGDALDEIEFPVEEEAPAAAATETPVDAVAEPEARPVEEVQPEPAVAEQEAVTEVETPELVEAEPEPEPVAEAPAAVTEVEPEPVAAREPIVVPTPQPERKPEPKPQPAAPAVKLTDVSGYDDAAIGAAIHGALDGNINVVRFGDKWMSENRVHRLSRGELRRIKDYIDEQEQPLTDESLVQDILGVRPNNPEYAAAVFSINARLAREREFEFVGTNDQRFWATTSLPPIGTDRRKHNDIGTDYRFLVEEVPADVERRSVTSVDHVVTFYEHALGLLPYDEDLQRLMPAPLTDDQRNAVFTFEIPQTYTTYLVELRYPTPNRGGFLLGLDDFYAESVVPGAVISISATENDGHFKVEYLQADETEDRLLELDDRRSPRYNFRPTSYACVVDDKWIISEDRFPNLGSEKPLADKVRRRNDDLLKATFERIGMDDDGGKLAAFDDLLAAVNIERPFSEAALRAALESDSSVSGDDANGYLYATGS